MITGYEFETTANLAMRAMAISAKQEHEPRDMQEMGLIVATLAQRLDDLDQRVMLAI